MQLQRQRLAEGGSGGVWVKVSLTDARGLKVPFV